MMAMKCLAVWELLLFNLLNTAYYGAGELIEVFIDLGNVRPEMLKRRCYFGYYNKKENVFAFGSDLYYWVVHNSVANCQLRGCSG